MSKIENVSDTARWVAVYRAMETERPDAIFKDPFAARLAGEKGESIVDTMKRGRSMAWAMIVRTKVFDEVILDRIHHGGVDQVVNLAAGLDARAWRLPVPRTLRWVDVDFPEILEYKLEKMRDEKPVCDYEAVKLDLRDEAKRQALFDQLGARSQRTLVVTEGLLIYLTAEQVGTLARDLHRPASFKWWLSDIAHPRLLKIMQKYWGKNVDEGNAPFQFAPAESTKFFEPFGWREAEFRSSMDEAQRLKREMPMMPVYRTIGRIQMLLWPFNLREKRETWRRFSGFPLLERV